MCIGWLLDLILGVPETPEQPGKQSLVGTRDSRDPFNDSALADYLDDMEQEELDSLHDDEWW